MARTISLVQQVQLASPCTIPWEAMVGDDRVRFCSHCRLNVFNFQEMSEAEAEQLIIKAEGRLCARIFRRYDGTILTKDCPVGLRAVRRRAVWLAMRAAAALAFIIVSAAYAVNGRRTLDPASFINVDPDSAHQRSAYLAARETVERWITATPPPQRIMFPGEIARPAPPVAVPPGNSADSAPSEGSS